jgi:hypothetical protein
MSANLAAGEPVSVPGTTTQLTAIEEVSAALTDVDELAATTNQSTSADPADTTDTTDQTDTTDTTGPSDQAGVADPDAQPDTAGGAPVVGESTDNGLLWKFVNSLGEPAFALEGENCDQDGCTQTAYILGTGTISPSPVKSRIDVSINTYINLLGYRNVHFAVGVFCYASQTPCGSKNSRNLAAKAATSRSAIVFLSSSNKLYSSKISFTLELWGKSPQGWRGTRGATDIAQCPAKPDTDCRW